MVRLLVPMMLAKSPLQKCGDEEENYLDNGNGKGGLLKMADALELIRSGLAVVALLVRVGDARAVTQIEIVAVDFAAILQAAASQNCNGDEADDETNVQNDGDKDETFETAQEARQ